MNDTVTSELTRVDEAFAGNRLLATFAADARDLLEPHGTIVELAPGEMVLRRGEDVLSSLFPFGSTMVSLLVEIAEGSSIEVASIGREGAVGGIVSCGHVPAFAQARVQVGGPALRLPMQALEDAKQESAFIANLFCRFSDYLLAQVMQSVACNAFHPIPQRAARWLLTAQDRSGDRLELTQEALADLLGAQRTTVNAVIATLQSEGLIAATRGVVTVIDRDGLKRRACECYRALEDHFSSIIGTSGSGGSARGALG